MKTLAQTLAAAILLAALAWTGTYLYWHIRLLGAVRTLETQLVGPEHPSNDATDVILDAGCRALPYLVGSLDPTKNVFYLSFATRQIAVQADTPGFENSPHSPAVGERTKEWRITPDDSAVQRQTKCDSIRAWWTLMGPRHHQTRRVWTSSCRPG